MQIWNARILINIVRWQPKMIPGFIPLKNNNVWLVCIQHARNCFKDFHLNFALTQRGQRTDFILADEEKEAQTAKDT